MSGIAHPHRITRLSACLASALAIVPFDAICTTRIVNTCADSGPGSLRDQITAPTTANGDVIDLSTAQLSCSTITLTSGQIPVAVDLTLLGPASRQVVITAAPPAPGHNRLLNVSGSLTVQNLTLTGGYYFDHSGAAKGGCIAATGIVRLIASTVSGCTAYSYSGSISKGGGIYAANVRLDNSTVSGNTASNYDNPARGGGIYTNYLRAYYSTISHNVATSRFSTGVGGGAFVGFSYSSSILKNSTLDSNFAQRAGGLYDFSTTTSQCLISNSTISGNNGTDKFGGVFCRVLLLTLQNSTLVFNSAAHYAGLYALSYQTTVSSSIIARNTNTAGGFADVFQTVGTWQSSDSIVSSYSPAPSNGPVTITADPQLAPLAYHGGLTRTHALLATSPAIDKGNNSQNLVNDQRGAGFTRDVPAGKPDIGAYERQVDDDELFFSGFD